MSKGSSARYYFAIVASAISVVGWLGFVAFGLYAVYTITDGGSAYWPSVGILVSFVVGAVFGKLEKELYRVE